MLRSKAANPPINPPNTQEFSMLPNQRTTAAPAISTNATATAFIKTPSYTRRLKSAHTRQSYYIAKYTRFEKRAQEGGQSNMKKTRKTQEKQPIPCGDRASEVF